jgi:hypothetical protein
MYLLLNFNENFTFLGSIRYLSEEGYGNLIVNSTSHKPKRNGNDTESEDENVTFARSTSHNSHGHFHRSSRKKSKSLKTK